MSVADLAKEFRTVLMEAQQDRDLRPELVTLPSGEVECEWAAYERDAMHREINRVRGNLELEAVPLESVREVEGLAVGHSDYTAKFALYCAELAVGIERIAP